MTDDNCGFWMEGTAIHEDALEQELHEQIAALTAQQKVAKTAAERDQLSAEIEQAHAAHKQKCAELPWLLF